jgi:hypothetical protein
MSDFDGSSSRKLASMIRRHASTVATSPRSFAASRIDQAVSKSGAHGVGAFGGSLIIAALPHQKLELEDVFAASREIVQLGKSTAHGLAPTALYRTGRRGVGPIHLLDRQASAGVTDYFES